MEKIYSKLDYYYVLDHALNRKKKLEEAGFRNTIVLSERFDGRTIYWVCSVVDMTLPC